VVKRAIASSTSDLPYRQGGFGKKKKGNSADVG